MKRGELYRVYRGSGNDPKQYRVFVIVARQVLVDSKFSTVTCAPVYTSFEGLSTQVQLGPDDGMKHSCAICCDELVSIRKGRLTDFVGSLSQRKLDKLKEALLIALEIES